MLFFLQECLERFALRHKRELGNSRVRCLTLGSARFKSLAFFRLGQRWMFDCSDCVVACSRCFHICDFHRYHFLWKTGAWNACRPKRGYAPCEDIYGVQTRNVTCVTKCGDALSAEYICAKFESKPPTEQICRLSCPEDCIMTEFSDWTSCDSCATANQTRSRTILALPSGGGKNCSDVTESRVCQHSASKCRNGKYQNFRYKLGRWTPCAVINGKRRRRMQQYIGLLGERTRNIRCVDHTGSLVEER